MKELVLPSSKIFCFTPVERFHTMFDTGRLPRKTNFFPFFLVSFGPGFPTVAGDHFSYQNFSSRVFP